MPRPKRTDFANYTYHILNRAVGKLQIFNTPGDYALFLRLLREATLSYEVYVFAYAIMPNHWHILLESKKDGEVARFMHWLTTTHTRQLHARTGTTGTGPLYQGRFKAFVVDSDEYFLTALRYIERNPVRAKLSNIAASYNWGSAWLRVHGTPEQKKLLAPLLEEHIPMYNGFINEPEELTSLATIRNSVNRGTPYGRESWVSKMIDAHDLMSTVRNRGRQKIITTHENQIKGA